MQDVYGKKNYGNLLRNFKEYLNNFQDTPHTWTGKHDIWNCQLLPNWFIDSVQPEWKSQAFPFVELKKLILKLIW